MTVSDDFMCYIMIIVCLLELYVIEIDFNYVVGEINFIGFE